MRLSSRVSFKCHVFSQCRRGHESRVVHTGAWSEKILMPMPADFNAESKLFNAKI